MSRFFEEVSFERAYEIAEEMKTAEREDTSSLTIFKGVHPTFGSILVVIPPLGESVVFPQAAPLVVRDLDNMPIENQ